MAEEENTTQEYQRPKISRFVVAMCEQYGLDYKEVKAFLFHNFPELQNKEICANCGESMKSYWQTVHSGIVGDLIQAIDFVKKNNRNSFHLAKDLNLSKAEYANFQKLRYHALVAKDKDAKEKGCWLITKRGGQFLRGEISIHKRVHTYRNRIIGYSDDMVHINQFRHEFPFFESDLAYEIQQGKLL